MSNDLVQFLRARLDEDEAYARNAFGDHNDAGPDWYEQWSGALNIGEAEDLVMTNDSQVSRFMERHDPACVLREVGAARQAIEHYERVAARSQQHPDYELATGAVEVQLKIRALPYAAHPDYHEEWAP